MILFGIYEHCEWARFKLQKKYLMFYLLSIWMDVPCKHFWKDFFLLGDDIEDDGDSNAGDRFTYMFIYLSVYLSIFPSIHPSIDLPTERELSSLPA